MYDKNTTNEGARMSKQKTTVRLVHAVVSRNYYGSHGGGVIMDTHAKEVGEPHFVTEDGQDMQLACTAKDCAKQYTFQRFTKEKRQQLYRADTRRRLKRLVLAGAMLAVGALLAASNHGMALLQGVGLGLVVSGIAVALLSSLMLIFGRADQYSLKQHETTDEPPSLGVRYVVHGVELT